MSTVTPGQNIVYQTTLQPLQNEFEPVVTLFKGEFLPVSQTGKFRVKNDVVPDVGILSGQSYYLICLKTVGYHFPCCLIQIP